MRIASAIVGIFVGAIGLGTAGLAQTTPAPVPEKMPFYIPYGTPISVEVARRAADAAMAEARRHDWKLAIAVVSPSGDLTFFQKMDDTQLGSIIVSQRKARTAAMFRRESEKFFEQMETGHPYISTLDPADIAASPGGFPIVVDGKLIGAIGCSGGAGSQDAVACKAGAAAVSR